MPAIGAFEAGSSGTCAAAAPAVRTSAAAITKTNDFINIPSGFVLADV